MDTSSYFAITIKKICSLALLHCIQKGQNCIIAYNFGLSECNRAEEEILCFKRQQPLIREVRMARLLHLKEYQFSLMKEITDSPMILAKPLLRLLPKAKDL